MILNDTDINVVNETFENVEKNGDLYLSISEKLVASYTTDFDELMRDLKVDIIDNEPTDDLLERYLLELNNILYFLGTKLESVGIKEDLSKMAAKEVFNTAYLDSREKDSERKNKTTIAELTAIAEEKSKYEVIINSIYSRVYKQLKFKMDAGYDMVNSIRKIITKRIQDAAASQYQRAITTPSNFKNENEVTW